MTGAEHIVLRLPRALYERQIAARDAALRDWLAHADDPHSHGLRMIYLHHAAELARTMRFDAVEVTEGTEQGGGGTA